MFYRDSSFVPQPWIAATNEGGWSKNQMKKYRKKIRLLKQQKKEASAIVVPLDTNNITPVITDVLSLLHGKKRKNKKKVLKRQAAKRAARESLDSLNTTNVIRKITCPKCSVTRDQLPNTPAGL